MTPQESYNELVKSLKSCAGAEPLSLKEVKQTISIIAMMSISSRTMAITALVETICAYAASGQDISIFVQAVHELNDQAEAKQNFSRGPGG